MAFSIALIVGFLSVSVFCVLGGIYSKRVEFYFLGVVILFLLGLSVVSEGYEVESGYVLDRNESVNGNDTVVDEVSSVTTRNVSNVWTNAFGLLFLLISAGLSLTFFTSRKSDRERRRRSLDVDDDF